MNNTENKLTAQNMILAHGLRAQAIVQEHIFASRLQGDTINLERWQSVEAAIAELRRSAPTYQV